jgi:hypothetical protein
VIGYVTFTFNSSNKDDQARIAAALFTQAKRGETLWLKASSSLTTGGTISVYVNNTGGVAVTFVSAYATDASGNLVNGTMLQPTSLSPTLPFTLATGTNVYTQFGKLLDTKVKPALIPNPITISLVTQRGNVFTAIYPPPGGGTINSATTSTSATTSECNPSDITCQSVSSFGIGSFSIDFSSYDYYVQASNSPASCLPGVGNYPTGCVLSKVGAQGSGYSVNLTLTKASPNGYEGFSIDVTNVDPSHDTIYLDQNSFMQFVVNTAGIIGTVSPPTSFTWVLGSVNSATTTCGGKPVALGSLCVVSFPTNGIPIAWDQKITLYFVEDMNGPCCPASTTSGIKNPSPYTAVGTTSFASTAGFIPVHGRMCPAANPTCQTPFGLNMDFVMTMWYPA